MLLEFSVKNYQSLKEEVTLDMKAMGSISEHQDSLIEKKALPLAVIYGPNGGGKSTVLKAFRQLKRLIDFGSLRRNFPRAFFAANSITPFKFDSETINMPTSFEVLLKVEDTEYKYSISVLKDTVVNEALSFRKNHEIVDVFVRVNDTIEVNERYREEIIVKNVPEYTPFISYVKRLFKVKPIEDVTGWFRRVEVIDFNRMGQEENLRRYLGYIEDDHIKEKFLTKLKELDTGISSYRIIEDYEEDVVRTAQIRTTHNVLGNEYELSIDEESAGTKKIFSLLPSVVLALENGTAIFIDELDAKLHPLLLEQIICLFRNKKTNPKGAQLIFTSHDLTTMNNKLFRRDEIWFICKGKEQYSDLYSLIEIRTENGKKVRKDVVYSKQYLEGRFGADPYFNRIKNWEEHYGKE